MERLRRTFALLAFVLLFALPLGANAATLTITPAAKTLSAGDLVTLRVLVNAQGTAVNNAEGVISFPTGMLQVVSVEKTGSIFSLWLTEPSFSNAAGTISFNGGVPNPGYSGNGGTAFLVTLRARQAGTASLSLGSAAVRANDGKGTDVLTGTNGAIVTISAAAATSPVTAPATQPITKPTTPTVKTESQAATTSVATTSAAEPATTTAALTIEPLKNQTLFTVAGFPVSLIEAFGILLLLILIALLAAFLSWYRTLHYREHLSGNVTKTANDVHRGFLALKADVERHVRAIEAAKTKRELTKEEKEFSEQMRENMREFEQYVDADLRKIAPIRRPHKRLHQGRSE